jgi:hypothetical protein
VIKLKIKENNVKFINIAEEQINKGAEMALKNHKDFFNEYFLTLEKEEQFRVKIQNVIENTNAELTRINIALLMKRVSLSLPFIMQVDKDIIIPNLVFFIGLDNFDGHGLIIKGEPYTFLNMTRINNLLENKLFTADVHLLHEIFHAIHYFYSPSFYIKSYTSIEHKYLKKMIAEGIATYFAKETIGASPENSLWFGLLGDKHFKEWVRKCRMKRVSIWKSIKNSIANNDLDTSLINTLFSVPGMKQEDLAKGRLGYYYGLKIVEIAARKEGTKILHLTYEKFKDYAKQYFEE